MPGCCARAAAALAAPGESSRARRPEGRRRPGLRRGARRGGAAAAAGLRAEGALDGLGGSEDAATPAAPNVLDEAVVTYESDRALGARAAAQWAALDEDYRVELQALCTRAARAMALEDLGAVDALIEELAETVAPALVEQEMADEVRLARVRVRRRGRAAGRKPSQTQKTLTSFSPVLRARAVQLRFVGCLIGLLQHTLLDEVDNLDGALRQAFVRVHSLVEDSWAVTLESEPERAPPAVAEVVQQASAGQPRQPRGEPSALEAFRQAREQR